MKRIVAATLTAILIAVALPVTTLASADPWYGDVPAHHWAHQAVRVLWQEQVTDGWVYFVPWGGVVFRGSDFRPSLAITRGEWSMFVVKGFGYPLLPRSSLVVDVPTNHREYGGTKLAAQYLYAAAGSGLIDIQSQRLRPRDNITRQHAVAGLLTALKLTTAADLLTSNQVDVALAPFRDQQSIMPTYRSKTALAVILGIIRGYPDSTIKPGNHLTRAEAATLLYRSCVIRIEASPNPFSPDGDGFEDETTFVAHSLKNRNLSIWSVSVSPIADFANAAPTVVFQKSSIPRGPSGGPYELTWDGKQDRTFVPDGLYIYQAQAQDLSGTRYYSVARPLWVQTRDLSLTLTPVYVVPGDQIRVRAITRGDATSVSVFDSSTSTAIDLQPALPPPQIGLNTWTGTIGLDEDTLPGQYEVEASAAFSSVTRSSIACYYVIDRERLTAQIDPSGAMPGDSYTIVARTTGQAAAVTVSLPWGDTVTMLPVGPDLWAYHGYVPSSTESGAYKFTVSADFAHRTLSTDLYLTVFSPGLSLTDLRFILSD